MDAEIEAVFADLPTVDVIRRLDAAHIANARMNTIDQFVEHPQLSARDAWRTIGSSVGSIPALVPPVRMEGVEPVMGAVPALGEHTDAILTELGFSPATVDTWRREQIV
jgi:crotonobetainyl-CoA:carnitine CoA-transferase CaiB-like acyl-CoA transferase